MKRSLSNKVWKFLEPDRVILEEIINSSGVSEIAAHVLMNRGLCCAPEVATFLDAKLSNTIPEPYLIKDMEKAVGRVIKAIREKEKIFVLGDYDVDGVTSSCILIKYLKHVGMGVGYHIPSRFDEGYGVSSSSIDLAKKNGADLFIAVDSGTNSKNEIDYAKSLGLDCIVIDHHIAKTELPQNAVAIVNPNRNDQDEILGCHIKNLCAAGVVFLFLVALQRELKKELFFEKAGVKEMDLRTMLDMVALGTVCDVMHLKGANRAFVRYAMAKERYCDGIEEIMRHLNIEKIDSAESFSFGIGPLINAAGRIADPNIALNLFLTDNDSIRTRLTQSLLEHNKTRKQLEQNVFNESLLQIAGQSESNIVFVHGHAWNEGVIGIVAGKLKEKFQKSSFVMAENSETGIVKGSARSAQGANLGKLFDKAVELKILIKGGGHAMAGGFTLHRDMLPTFKEFLESAISDDTVIPTIRVDCTISARSNLDDIVESIAVLEPFGPGVEVPLFCFMRLRMLKAEPTRNPNHMTLFLQGESGGSLRCMLFNANTKQDIVKAIGVHKDNLFDIVATIRSSAKFGHSLIIEDIALSQ